MKKTIFIGSTLMATCFLFYSFFILQQHNEMVFQKALNNYQQGLNNTGTKNKIIGENTKDYLSFIAATPSLSGTEVDGAFEFDENGNLVINKGMRYIFEYFFSSLGEQDLDSIRLALSSYAKSRLTSDDHQQVMALYDNYLKARAFNSEQNFSGQSASSTREGLEELKQHFYDLKQHRRSFLSSKEAEVFYAEEEAYDEFSINRMQINKDNSLSASEKQLAINTFEDNLPESQKDIRDAINQSENLDAILAGLRERNASVDEIYYARAQVLGDEKAQRLLEFENEQAHWNNRYQQYVNQQQVIIDSQGLSNGDKQEQITHLLEQNFSEREVKEINRMQRVQLAKEVSAS